MAFTDPIKSRHQSVSVSFQQNAAISPLMHMLVYRHCEYEARETYTHQVFKRW